MFARSAKQGHQSDPALSLTLLLNTVLPDPPSLGTEEPCAPLGASDRATFDVTFSTADEFDACLAALRAGKKLIESQAHDEAVLLMCRLPHVASRRA